MVTIKVAEQFSRFPAGRFEKDGPFSGELFRRKYLVPALEKSDDLVVELDGARGYGSSFLEEAFGGLVRHGLPKDLVRKIKILATNQSLRAEIYDYIDKALPAKT